MKKIGIILFSTSLLFCFSACMNSSDSIDQAEKNNEQKDDLNGNNVKEKAAEFAVKASAGGLGEVKLSQLAKEKSSNQSVLDFADMMVKDHSAANAKLSSIAMAKNITLPTSLSAEDQNEKDKLSQLSGNDFDKEYIDYMEDAHEKTISLFEDALNSIKDPEMYHFINETLPTLKGHLADCKNVQDELK